MHLGMWRPFHSASGDYLGLGDIMKKEFPNSKKCTKNEFPNSFFMPKNYAIWEFESRFAWIFNQ